MTILARHEHWAYYITTASLYFIIQMHFLTLSAWILFFPYSGHSPRKALFIYRLIVMTLIGNFLVFRSEIEIKILAKRDIYGTLGSKGFNQLNILSSKNKVFRIVLNIQNFPFPSWKTMSRKNKNKKLGEYINFENIL